MLAEQRDTEMGVRRRSASATSSGSLNTHSMPWKPCGKVGRDGVWPWGGGGGALTGIPPPESATRRSGLRGDSYVRRPRVGCPVVPATDSR